MKTYQFDGINRDANYEIYIARHSGCHRFMADGAISSEDSDTVPSTLFMFVCLFFFLTNINY